MANEVSIKITADSKDAASQLEKLQKNLGKVGDKAKEAEGKGSGLQSGMSGWAKGALAVGAALVGLYMGLKKVTSAMADLTAAYATQEAAEYKLNTALKITNQYTKQASDAFKNYAASLQMISGVGDEVILNGLAIIQNLSGSKEAAMKSGEAMLGLSKVLGIDTAGSAKLLGKVLADPIKNMSMLSRYGVSVNTEMLKGKTIDEQRAMALELLNNKFGEQANSMSTLASKISLMNGLWGDLKEKGGEVLAGALKPILDTINGQLKNALDTSAAWIPKLSAIAKKAGSALRPMIKDLINVGKSGDVFDKLEAGIKKISTGVLYASVAFSQLKSAAVTVASTIGSIGSAISTAFDYTPFGVIYNHVIKTNDGLEEQKTIMEELQDLQDAQEYESKMEERIALIQKTNEELLNESSITNLLIDAYTDGERVYGTLAEEKKAVGDAIADLNARKEAEIAQTGRVSTKTQEAINNLKAYQSQLDGMDVESFSNRASTAWAKVAEGIQKEIDKLRQAASEAASSGRTMIAWANRVKAAWLEAKLEVVKADFKEGSGFGGGVEPSKIKKEDKKPPAGGTGKGKAAPAKEEAGGGAPGGSAQPTPEQDAELKAIERFREKAEDIYKKSDEKIKADKLINQAEVQDMLTKGIITKEESIKMLKSLDDLETEQMRANIIERDLAYRTYIEEISDFKRVYAEGDIEKTEKLNKKILKVEDKTQKALLKLKKRGIKDQIKLSKDQQKQREVAMNADIAKAQEIADAMSAISISLGENLTKILADSSANFRAFFTEIGNMLVNMLMGVIKAAQTRAIADAIASVYATVPFPANIPASVGAGVQASLPFLPLFAIAGGLKGIMKLKEGAFFDSPRGAVAHIGEAGREVAIPLENPRALAAMGEGFRKMGIINSETENSNVIFKDAVLLTDSDSHINAFSRKLVKSIARNKRLYGR